VLTDRKPLTFALDTTAGRYAPREVCHLDFISQYTNDIQHVKGPDNPVADALSRPQVNTICAHPEIDLFEMATAQDINEMRSWSKKFQLQYIPLSNNKGTILADVST